jgi:hypothetical protein
MKEMFLSNGFNDFLSKPIEINKLNEILEKWIPKEKKEKYTVEHKEKLTVSPVFEIEGINVAYGITMAGESVSNYLKILSVFYKDGMKKIMDIKECFKKNTNLYMIHVHALKSALSSIGAKDLSEIAKSLELAGKCEDMAYLDSNNDIFLEKLEILLGNIEHVVSQNNATEENSLSLESLNEKMQNLKKALVYMDTMTTDKIINELYNKHFSSKIKDALEQITQNILLCDYDDAIYKINILIEELNTDQ